MIETKDSVALKLANQQRAFGNARTPLTQVIGDKRLVVAGNQVFQIPARWTFHEFIIDYGRNKLGKTWLNNEIKRDQPHPLASYYVNGMKNAKPTGETEGSFIEFTMNAEMYAFLTFAYDLFTLMDNTHVQDSLLERVLNPKLYEGARYEIYAAACFIRGGFKIEFEDESDSTRSHCEFTATSHLTGRSYSLEAKSRSRAVSADDKPQARMYKILQAALKKNASFERIIFADVNLPPDTEPLFQQDWHQEVGATLTELEKKQKSENPWPSAIIFFTNRTVAPWQFPVKGNSSTVLLTALNHELFKQEDRDKVESAYPEIGTLLGATLNLGMPPRHFFGQ